MARYFEIKPGLGGWNLEREEELVLIDAYYNLKSKMTPDASWTEEFENTFFNSGLAVLVPTLIKLNMNLGRHNLPYVEFTETEVTNYVRDSQFKEARAAARREMRDELLSKTAEERRRIVQHAAALVSTLPPARKTWADFAEERDARDRDTRLRVSEVDRRQAAVGAIVRSPTEPQPVVYLEDERPPNVTPMSRPTLQLPARPTPQPDPEPEPTPAPQPKAPPLALSLAIKMLTATQSADLHSRIIARVSVDDLAELLESDLSQPLKDQIIEQILAG